MTTTQHAGEPHTATSLHTYTPHDERNALEARELLARKSSPDLNQADRCIACERIAVPGQLVCVDHLTAKNCGAPAMR
jgi:hypothetical protein